MRFAPNCAGGRRLRRYGVSSKTLEKTRVYAIRWQPALAFTVPVPFAGCIILVRRTLLDLEADSELADSAALALLVHQFCHAHQRVEWGFFPYLWRHLWARLVSRSIPVRHRQVEREAYNAERQVQESYSASEWIQEHPSTDEED